MYRAVMVVVAIAFIAVACLINTGHKEEKPTATQSSQPEESGTYQGLGK